MSSFELAEDLYHDAKFTEAHVLFKKALTETPSNQLIFPYIVATAIEAKEFDKIDHYLSFYFKNYLITDIFSIEKEFEEKSFWEYLSSEIEKNNVKLSALSNLILKYFEADYDDRMKLLTQFTPASSIEEYWRSAFYLNICTKYKRKEADTYLQKCLDINDKCALPYFLAYFTQHELSNTIEYLDKALKLKPDYFEVLKEKARAYFEDHDIESYPEAIKVCDKIMYLNPSKDLLTWALWVKGFSLVQLKKYSEGIICYNQSLQIDNEQNIYLDRASAKNRMKDYSGALTDFLKYVELAEEDIHPSILTAIGTVYLNLKKFHEAIKYYTDAIEINGNSSIVYLRRASAFRAINQKMLAETDIKTANQIVLDKKESYYYHVNISEDEL